MPVRLPVPPMSLAPPVVLPATMVSVSEAAPGLVPVAMSNSPPPLPAEFAAMVQKVSVAVPELNSPPPSFPAEFAATVQRVRVAVPELNSPPPSPAAELPLIVQSVSATVPRFSSPPPLPLTEPPVIVRPEMLAVTPPSTWNTRLAWLPVMVTPTFGGPVIVVVVAGLVLLSSSAVPWSVMVWALPKTAGSKVITLPAYWSARLTAPGSVKVAAVVVIAPLLDSTTRRLTWKAPMSTTEPRLTPRSSVETPLKAIPVAMAGLLDLGAMVGAGPPLSCSDPSCGSAVEVAVKLRSVAPLSRVGVLIRFVLPLTVAEPLLI